MATEKTPLTSTPPNFASAPAIPFYVQDTYRFYSRRRRERQLQCIMFLTIVATFIMALIVTVSYSVSQPEADSAGKSSAPEEPEEVRLLKDSGPGPEALSAEELQLALEAGEAAVAARRLADSQAQPLAPASAESRHQFAVGTGARARRIAMAAVAEIAATRELEAERSRLGRPSGFSSFLLDAGWSREAPCAPEPACSSKYRRIDGSCNDPRQRGRAFAAYRRALPADYADGIEAPRLGKFGNPLPSAREISLKVHPPSPSTNPSFSVMLAVFGQFLDHDITATAISQGINGSSLSCCPPAAGHPECFPVKVAPGDPVYDIAGRSCMEFVRSAPAAQCRIGPRQQLNQVTAFIDGSTIYGSDLETADSLREFSGGRLRMQKTPDNRELLPASKNPQDGCNQAVELARGRYCFTSGDRRANENLHLTTMHVLWARQHNLLVGRLSQLNPQWDDETLYQEARRIVGAQLQHISYREFLPIVLGESEMARRNLKPLNSTFREMNASQLDPTIDNNFAAAAFRFAHTLLPGLMKVTDMQKGTSSYVQLHKILFNPYSLYAQGGVESSITSATTNSIQKTSTHVTSQLTEHLFEDPMANQSSLPCGLDLVSLNIQRGRDHGLPGYTKWREHCALGNPLNFDDLKDDMDPEALDAISKLYANVDDIDLYTGALAELPKGTGLLGPTFTCLIADQFQRLQLGDRYWYEFANQPGSFNEDQLKEIRKTTLARIICDTSDEITQVQLEVMRSVSKNNPIVSCEDMPQLSLDAWKSELPMLTLSESEVPFNDWIYFKTEVNKTLTDLMYNIVDKNSPPGTLPSDWLDFQSNINKTFTDLKNKFSALHPKVIKAIKPIKNLTTELQVFDWMIIQMEVNNTVAEIIDAVSANKPPPGSLPADWIMFKKRINDSLTDIQKKFKILHPKSVNLKSNSESIDELADTSIIDWTQIKNDINTTIQNIVNSINATKPLPGSPVVDWMTFKSKIVNSLFDVKNKFKDLHPKTKVDMYSARNLSAELEVFDWLSIQNEVNSTVAEIIDVVSANKPPPGSLPADWIMFKKRINDSLTDVKKKFKILHPKSVNLKSNLENIDELADTSIIDWTQIKNDINTTIQNIVNSINATKPLPGSPVADWMTFKSKFVNSLFDVKNKFKDLHPKTKVDMYSARNLSAELEVFDWSSIQNEVNSTVAEIIDVVSANKPPPGSLPADWIMFKKRINDSLTDVKKKFKILHPKSVNLKSNSISTDELVDWSQIKNDINSTIQNIVSSINATKPLPGSPPADWLEFKNKIVNSLVVIKNKFQAFTPQIQYSILKLPAITVDQTFDWVEFQRKLNESITKIITSIRSKKSPADSAVDDWSQFQKEVNSTFTDMMKQFSNLDRNLNSKSDQLLSDKFDNVTETNTNKSVKEIIAELNASKPEPGSPQEDWDTFRQKMTNAFANMKNKYVSLENNIKTTVKLSSVMIDNNSDVLTFQENLNISLSNLMYIIKTHRPATNSSMSAWLAYKKEVKVSLNKIKDLFSQMKTKESMEPEYVLYEAEIDGAFDWIAWKTEINKTIDNLIDEVKNISLGNDPNWISFQAYVTEQFINLKNKASTTRTKLLKPKLMAVIEENWSDFKDKVKEISEESFDDLNSNTLAPKDPAWIKSRFTKMHEDLKAIETAWIKNLKTATNMMVVSDIPFANSSASILILHSSSFNTLLVLIPIVYVASFMRISIYF